MVKITKIKGKKPKKLLKTEKPNKKKPKTGTLGKLSVEDFFEKFNDEDSPEETRPDQQSDEEMENIDVEEQHKNDLEKLKVSDPEFYKFLQENDKKLLNFNLSDEEEIDEESDDEVVHKLQSKLEVASDESDFEDSPSTQQDERKLTLKTLKTWRSQITTDKSNKTIVKVIGAFHAALARVSGDSQEEPTSFLVEGSSVFNAVIQLCVLDLGPALRRFLGLKQGSRMPHKCKKFVKVKGALKGYFTDLLKLLLHVTSSNIQTVLLKHLHYMSNLLVSFPNLTKSLLKRLIGLWGTAEDSVRVVAFFCILRIANNHKNVQETIIKTMYLSYVTNSKFVNLNSLASVNFMRRSLVEILSLDLQVAYQHVFLYIRQLAIHLRNAITMKKKENIQAVCNWQFINSLKLWANFLAINSQNSQQIEQLIYPLVQICLGTMKLVPTAQYFPLRFHVIELLVNLSKETAIFIPIVPFLLEIFEQYDFNKKHQKVSMKPLNFTCLLRLSKSQLQENAFTDTTMELVYANLLEILAMQAHSVAFPDLSLICVVHIKEFNKKCRTVQYTRKFKSLLAKIQQNCDFIEKERRKLNLNLSDFKQINGWEAQVKTCGPPLQVFYENWNKLRTIKKNKELTNNEVLGDYNLPTIKRKESSNKKTKGPVELFPSDSEDETEENTKKSRRGKRGSRKVVHEDYSQKVQDNGVQDLVEDIDLSNW